MLTPKKRHTIFNSFLTPVKTFNLSLQTQSKLIKYKKKTLTVNEVFEDFTNKFHYVYFKKLCFEFYQIAVVHLNDQYQNKKEAYIKFEDQIQELDIMFSEEGNC